ncbi:MAG: MBL fold metallo-hydrolase [Bacillota bacterium]
MTAEKLDYLRILVLAENTVPFDRSLLGQHGLSFFIEGKREQTTLRVIMDVGQDHGALCHNMKSLNVSTGDVDAIVLSHCHFDHTTGVTALLAATGKSGVPVIAHPDIFRTHFFTAPVLRSIGMVQDNSAAALSAAGGKPFLTRDPLQLMPGLMTTGEVPRITPFEEGGLNVFTLKDGHMQKDNIPDDISLVACVQGRGLVVMTGCSHAGIINIIKQAVSIFPGEKLYAVIGGLHLYGAPAERVKRTVEELAEFYPALVAAGHCTGFKAQVELHNALGEQFTPLTAGAEFIIS